MLMLERIVSVFAPHSCLGCGSEGSALLCPGCREVLPVVPSRCYACKAVSEGFHTCRQCRRHTHLNQVLVATFYESHAKELIHSIKYSRAQSGARDVGMVMAPLLDWLTDDPLLCFVPTATSRVRMRGYDQAELIQKQLCYTGKLRGARLLARSGQAHQVGANRTQRLRQLDGVFRVTQRNLVRGRNIILVDDVLTTGATLESAAKTLKQAGAQSVGALVFAQA